MRQQGRGPKTVYRHELLSVSELVFAGITLFLKVLLLLVIAGSFAGVLFAILNPDRAIPFGRGTAIVVLPIGFFVPTIDYVRTYRLRIGTISRLLAVAFGCALIPLAFALIGSILEIAGGDFRFGSIGRAILFASLLTVPVIIVWYGSIFVRGPIVIREKGQCRACGYNLCGTLSSVCSECSTPRLAMPVDE